MTEYQRLEIALRQALSGEVRFDKGMRDAAEAHGLTFAPDPVTHSRCTLGGMIGNNSCGPHSVMAGTTVQIPNFKRSLQKMILNLESIGAGFSCREQIETLTGRRTLHLAELLAGR